MRGYFWDIFLPSLTPHPFVCEIHQMIVNNYSLLIFISMSDLHAMHLTQKLNRALGVHLRFCFQVWVGLPAPESEHMLGIQE